jgi:hypothetical protein
MVTALAISFYCWTFYFENVKCSGFGESDILSHFDPTFAANLMGYKVATPEQLYCGSFAFVL